MPNQPRKGNTSRSFRVDEDLWDAVRKRAAERGETVTDVLVRALRRYVR